MTELKLFDFNGWISTSQASRVLGVSVPRVHQLTAEDKLNFMWTPLGRLYRKSDVLALLYDRAGIEKPKEVDIG